MHHPKMVSMWFYVIQPKKSNFIFSISSLMWLSKIQNFPNSILSQYHHYFHNPTNICILIKTRILWLWCLVIFYSNVVSSFHGAFTFSPPLFSLCNIDPSNDLDHENHMSDDVLALETYLHVVYSKLGIKKGNYDAIKMFQDFRVAKLRWTWLSLGLKGSLHVTKCKICNVVERKNKLFAPKWDSIYKHVGHMKANKNIGNGV